MYTKVNISEYVMYIVLQIHQYHNKEVQNSADVYYMQYYYL
jgi:hypothetical protein